MDQPDREVEPQFTQPVRQIMVMLIILALVSFIGYIAYPRVSEVFLANLYLNGFIFFVFVIGVLACFWQVLQLINSVNWIEGFAGGRPGQDIAQAPRLLAPLAALLRSRGAKMQIGASSSRSILDSVATRIDEARDITRYIVNLLIFLGLLGTFYGLATTVPAVVETIRSLAPRDGEGSIEIFSRLMNGLEAQLGGMGVAFSSSLLGLAGSLVVGLLELFASHGQNRFYRELEEWLSTITRLGFSSGDSDGDGGHDSGASAALLEVFSEQMDALQTLYTQSDVSRSLVDESLVKLAASVEALTARLEGAEQTSGALNRVADGQGRLIAVMEKRNEEGGALNRVADGQDQLIAVMEKRNEEGGALDRVADGQDRIIAVMEKRNDDGGALNRVADGQDRLISVIEKRDEEGGAHVDAESRMRLRSIDVQLLRILEEMSAGRQESLADLRTDLNALVKAVRQMSRETTSVGGRRG